MSNRTHNHTPVTDEAGQTMAEYSVLIGFLVLVVALAIPSVGSAIGGLYSGFVQVLGS
jgi:Flp pilus assembly pilin Flp